MCLPSGFVYAPGMIRRAAALKQEDQPRYLEPVVPIVFPEEAEVPETQLHLELRTLLYQLLTDYLGEDATVGSDQFMYFDASDPQLSLAPDVCLRQGPRGEPIRSWKVWERGAPDVAIEIVSASDAPASTWELKLDRYRRSGVKELIRFDPEDLPPAQLRIWDRVGGALVERELTTARAPSAVLGIDWVVAEAENHPIALRIAEGERLIPTRLEARKVEAEARQRAEARVRELEALLKQRS